MHTTYKLSALLYAVLLFIAVPAHAQSSDDEVAVWATVEQQWRAAKRGDNDWVDELLSADFVGWPTDSPAPRNKASTRLWNDFNSRQTELLEFELYPQAIVIHGDMAVVHYLYTAANKAKGGDVEFSSGRYSDILVRSEDGWRFVAWHGGNDN